MGFGPEGRLFMQVSTETSVSPVGVVSPAQSCAGSIFMSPSTFRLCFSVCSSGLLQG